MNDPLQSRQHSTTSDRTDPVFQVRNAAVTFDMDRGKSRVLDDVSLDIERGEILAIVGESGSGKSMLASALLNAVEDPGVLSGTITYSRADGTAVDVTAASDADLKRLRWRELSMVFQGAMSAFNPTQTIRKHFIETLKAHEEPLESGMARARELLEDLYLDPDRVLDSYPHELSGGMSQRALIALSLILDPEVLVMDEPTAALDLLMQRSILRLIADLQEKYDLTVVFITHDLPLVADLADRIAVMYAFDVAEVGPTEQILSTPAHPYTRALLRAVPNLDAPLDTMRPIEGSAPDPVNTMDGCRYAPRCPLATDECRTDDPGPSTPTAGHAVYCHHWEQSAAELPLDVHSEESSASESGSIGGTGAAPATSPAETPVLSLDGVTKQFTTGSSWNPFAKQDSVTAVDDVSLDIYENDVVALVGESGCGKTTLGRMAIGAETPTDGTITYHGTDITDARGTSDFLEIRKTLQMIHQDPGSALNPNRRVEKSLTAPLRRWEPELTEDGRREKIFDMLETVGMTPAPDYAARYPHQLSGGEQQRVALIRALLMNPDVIFADEAVSALDVSLRVEMMDLFLELQDEFDTSFLFISHDLSNARYLAERAGGRIGVMYLGELVEIGPAAEVLTNPKHPYTQVLRWATADLDADDGVSEPPVRSIDIPDPKNPPSGCSFHPRCPEAREICTQENPTEAQFDDSHCAACFRDNPDHDYWDSHSITQEE